MSAGTSAVRRAPGRRSVAVSRAALIESRLPAMPTDNQALTLYQAWEDYFPAYSRRAFSEKIFKTWQARGYIPQRYILRPKPRKVLVTRRGMRFCQAYLAGEGIEV